MMQEIKTWKDLADAIDRLTPLEKLQPIQVVKSPSEPMAVGLPGLAIGTVTEMGFEKHRSPADNEYHGEDVVLLIDGNPFSATGVVAYQLKEEDGKTVQTPIFGKRGPTDIAKQTAPQAPPQTPGELQAYQVPATNYVERRLAEERP